MACASASFLQKFTRFTSLTLYNRDCFPSLSFFTNLSYLKVPGSSLPPTFTLLTNLTKLEFKSSIALSSLRTLSKLTSLKCHSVHIPKNPSPLLFPLSLRKLSCVHYPSAVSLLRWASLTSATYREQPDEGYGAVDFGKAPENMSVIGKNLAIIPENFTKFSKIQTDNPASNISPFFLTNLVSLSCSHLGPVNIKFLENLRYLHVELYSSSILELPNLEKLFFVNMGDIFVFRCLTRLRTLKISSPSRLLIKSPRGTNIWTPEAVSDVAVFGPARDDVVTEITKFTNLKRLEVKGFGNIQIRWLYTQFTSLVELRTDTLPSAEVVARLPHLTFLESLKIQRTCDTILYI
jgi:hypothetical protein